MLMCLSVGGEVLRDIILVLEIMSFCGYACSYE